MSKNSTLITVSRRASSDALVTASGAAAIQSATHAARESASYTLITVSGQSISDALVTAIGQTIQHASEQQHAHHG